jgi:prevent-host-death family protein
MKEVTFTQFRKEASALFATVENGETLCITRHGKPIANISPYDKAGAGALSWKKIRPKKHLSGASLADVILHEREL